MKKTITIALMILMTATAFAQGATGTYTGTAEGITYTCKMVQTGSQLTGVMKDNHGITMEFEGTVSGKTSKGQLIANNTYMMNYTATFSGMNCTFVISAEGFAESSSFQLTKSGAAPTATTAKAPAPKTVSKGNLDQRIVGRWMKETHSSTTGSADYASFTSVKYFQFNGDGTYSVTNGGSGGTGTEYTGAVYGNSSSAGGVIESGTWYVQNGDLYTNWGSGSGHTYYQFSDGRLVLGRGGNYKFLSPAN